MAHVLDVGRDVDGIVFTGLYHKAENAESSSALDRCIAGASKSSRFAAAYRYTVRKHTPSCRLIAVRECPWARSCWMAAPPGTVKATDVRERVRNRPRPEYRHGPAVGRSAGPASLIG